MEYRQDRSGRIRWRSVPKPPRLISAIRLQTARGEFRTDARERLGNPGHDGLDAGPMIRQWTEKFGLEGGVWADAQVALLSAPDPIPVLANLKSGVPLTFFRLRTETSLWRRLLLWQAITELASGTPAERVVETLHGKQNFAVSGLIELAPASVICGPLLARQEPLAAVLITDGGAQVAVLPARGVFRRPIRIVDWPIGMVRLSFAGPGLGTHATGIREFTAGHAESMLLAATRGANRLMDHLTSPQEWTASDDIVDLDSRWMTWSSVLFGLDAIASLSATWMGADTLWVAFRALSILQGIWNGDRHDSVLLDHLLDPRRIHDFAITALPQGQERVYGGGIVANYERDLHTAFPGEELDAILKKLTQLRHLVHGVRGRAGSTIRLEVLRQLEHATPNLQLINEVAAYWWMAVLLRPRSYCRVGFAPWELSPAS